MKRSWNYYKVKWTAFFATVLILGLGLTTLYIMRPQQESSMPDPLPPSNSAEENAGYYSNEAFSQLIEENLSEFGFLKSIVFKGTGEGNFTLQGVLASPDRLIAVCSALKPYSTLLNALKNESILVKGHIGENELGNGCFVTDTITFSSYTLPAAIATSYIDEYTGLNDLLEVPIQQIDLSEAGITFREELPAVIQIALYNEKPSSPSASQ